MRTIGVISDTHGLLREEALRELAGSDLIIHAGDAPELWDQLKEKAGQGPSGPRTFEVAFHPRVNRWRGEARLELELQAIRFPD